MASDAITGSKRINHFLQKTGIIRVLPMRFGMVELIDDLTDHWDYKEHEHERDALLRLLMVGAGRLHAMNAPPAVLHLLPVAFLPVRSSTAPYQPLPLGRALCLQHRGHPAPLCLPTTY